MCGVGGIGNLWEAEEGRVPMTIPGQDFLLFAYFVLGQKEVNVVVGDVFVIYNLVLFVTSPGYI